MPLCPEEQTGPFNHLSTGHQAPCPSAQCRSGHGIQLTTYLYIVLALKEDYSYQNIRQEFFLI